MRATETQWELLYEGYCIYLLQNNSQLTPKDCESSGAVSADSLYSQEKPAVCNTNIKSHGKKHEQNHVFSHLGLSDRLRE